MQVVDWLNTYIAKPPMPLVQMALNQQLRNDLNNWADNSFSNGVNWAVQLMRSDSGGSWNDRYANIKIENVMNVLKMFGLNSSSTITEVDNLFVDIPIIPNVYWRSVNKSPVIPYDEFPIINNNQMDDLIRRDFNVASDVLILGTDREYRVLTKEALQILLDACPSKNLTYEYQRADCDDFMRVLRGWVSSLGYGNLAIGELHINCYHADGSLADVHACNVAIISESLGYKCVVIEPQTCEIKPLNYAISGGVSNNVFRVVF